MYLTRQMTDYTLTDIGNILKKDHSTVMHGIDTIKDLVDNNDDIKHQVEVITNSITM